jgi:hypothetical protein
MKHNKTKKTVREVFTPYIIIAGELRLILVVAVQPGDPVAKNYINFTTMRITAVICLLLLNLPSYAQDLLGYGHSNYAGIAGASYNPASLADSRYRMDIMLGGFGIEVANNYVGIKRSELRNPDFGPQNLYFRDRDTKKSVFVRNEILLPGIMFSNEKFGWGIDMKVRTYANVDGVENRLAHIFAFELNDPPNFEQSLYNKHIGIQALSWMEIGGTYARVLRAGAEHYLAAGVRPKFLLGLGAAYVFLNDAGYNFWNDSTLTIVRGDVNFGHSDNFTFDGGYGMNYSVGFNPGFGLDAGIIYEYRPDVMQAKAKDKKEREWPGYRERAEYKYRIGIAITDLGIIHFRHGEFSDHYTVEANLWDLDDETFDATSPVPLYNTFEARNGGTKSTSGMWMRLPLALNTQFDYNVGHDIYINATAFTALYLRNWDGKRVHELTRISVTPRWEKRWFAVWAPVSFTRMGTVSLGTGFRIGPLAIGTTDILNFAMKNKTIYNADLYFVLKIPLFPIGNDKIRKDKNKGGAIDECPD